MRATAANKADCGNFEPLSKMLAALSFDLSSLCHPSLLRRILYQEVFSLYEAFASQMFPGIRRIDQTEYGSRMNLQPNCSHFDTDFVDDTA